MRLSNLGILAHIVLAFLCFCQNLARLWGGMFRAYKISPVLICSIVVFLSAGELISKTPLYYVALMAIAMLCGMVTYNLLGGLSTIGGFFFATLFVRTIAFSQFIKVILLEPADGNLERPQLTILVYAVFYMCLMVGAYVSAGIRLKLPKPASMEAGSYSMALYAVTFVIGAAASVAMEATETPYGGESQYGVFHQLGVALSWLLLLSEIVAIERRLELSEGKKSFDIWVLLPWTLITYFGFIDTERRMMIMPVLIYIAICYLRKFHFRFLHVALFASGMVAFYFVMSPFATFARFALGSLPLSERIAYAPVYFASHHDPREIASAANSADTSGAEPRENYFNRPSYAPLSRFALIRMDSNLVNATATGNHYGFDTIRIKLESITPSVISKNKRMDILGDDYIGRITGVSGDAPGVTAPSVSPVAESYGAFGWLGVVIIPLFVYPLFFVEYNSIFNMRDLWSIIAIGLGINSFAEEGIYGIVGLSVRLPVILIVVSFLIHFVSGRYFVRSQHTDQPEEHSEVAGAC